MLELLMLATLMVMLELSGTYARELARPHCWHRVFLENTNGKVEPVGELNGLLKSHRYEQLWIDYWAKLDNSGYLSETHGKTQSANSHERLVVMALGRRTGKDAILTRNGVKGIVGSGTENSSGFSERSSLASSSIWAKTSFATTWTLPF
jgi:hypothetical protein